MTTLNTHGLPILPGPRRVNRQAPALTPHPLDCHTLHCRAVATHQLNRARYCDHCYDRIQDEQILAAYP